MVYVCMFQGTGILNIQCFTSLTFMSAIFKVGGRQYNCHHIETSTSPRAIRFKLLDSNIKGFYLPLTSYKSAAVLKMSSVKAYYFES